MAGLRRKGYIKKLPLKIGVCLLWVALPGCSQFDQQYVYHDENVKGPVKKVVEYTYGAQKDSTKWVTADFYGKKIFKFSRRGQLTSKRLFGPDTTLIERHTYQYRSRRRVRSRRFTGQGKVTHRKDYTYPWFYGDVSARVLSPGDSLMWKESYVFNDEGRQIRKKVYGPNDRLRYLITYRYNPKGYIIQEMGADKRTYHFRKRDERGNWIRRINTEDKIKTSITVRDITYY